MVSGQSKGGYARSSCGSPVVVVDIAVVVILSPFVDIDCRLSFAAVVVVVVVVVVESLTVHLRLHRGSDHVDGWMTSISMHVGVGDYL